MIKSPARSRVNLNPLAGSPSRPMTAKVPGALYDPTLSAALAVSTGASFGNLALE
jgi:hypothetical protein